MKNIPTFEQFINEGVINERASWGVQVEEPFSDKDERKAQDKFVMKSDPITIVGSSGFISEDETELSVQFSNADRADYYWAQSHGTHPAEMTIYYDGNKTFEVKENTLDKYLGSTGTAIGDIALIYRDWKLGKIK